MKMKYYLCALCLTSQIFADGPDWLFEDPRGDLTRAISGGHASNGLPIHFFADGTGRRSEDSDGASRGVPSITRVGLKREISGGHASKELPFPYSQESGGNCSQEPWSPNPFLGSPVPRREEPPFGSYYTDDGTRKSWRVAQANDDDREGL